MERLLASGSMEERSGRMSESTSASRPGDAGSAAETDPFPTRYAAPTDSPGFLLWQVTMRWQRRQRTALEGLGLTHVQFVLLAGIAWFARAGQPVTQARLAQFISVDVMMTSEVVRALERKGLVRRARHPRDARAWSLALTEPGAATIRQALPLVEAADHAFFAAVGAEVADLTRLLNRLLAAGDADPAPPAAVQSAG